jgi:hypothetical protein
MKGAAIHKCTVLERARRYVAKCPPAISKQEGHKATFKVACVLVRGFALGEAEALRVLREWNQSCQPPWSEAELQHKVTSAARAKSTKRDGYLLDVRRCSSNTGASKGARKSLPKLLSTPAGTTPRKSLFSAAVLERVARLLPHVDADFVRARSPLRPEVQTPATFLLRLYEPGESVLVFTEQESQGLHVCTCTSPPHDTRCLDHLVHGHGDGVWFLSNPVDGEYHPNPRQGGKRSRRSEESVTAWRYLLLESDKAEARPWLAALVQMPLRIAAIYTSGRRSIHALIRVDATSKLDWDAKAQQLKAVLEILGADPSAMTAVRLTRLPGCYRGEQGPLARKPVTSRRWVDETLRYDASGDPIWTPDQPPYQAEENPWTGGQLQELLYLNPNPDRTPICRRPTLAEVCEQWRAAQGCAQGGNDGDG